MCQMCLSNNSTSVYVHRRYEHDVSMGYILEIVGNSIFSGKRISIELDNIKADVCS